jgi:V-type H+-transporting ATPase subunit C
MLTHRFLQITDNEGNQLWTVTLFRFSVEEFINKARSQLKVYVREVEYNVEAYEEEKGKLGELTEKIQVTESDLKKNCEIVYSALFESMMHLKVLRGHVESVLRWGVPPKYLLSIVKAQPGKEKKMIQNLIKLFANPGSIHYLLLETEKGMYGTKEEIGELEDYFPYILIPFGITIQSNYD